MLVVRLLLKHMNLIMHASGKVTSIEQEPVVSGRYCKRRGDDNQMHTSGGGGSLCTVIISSHHVPPP